MNLLLAEDEVSVSNFIKKGFESEGYILDVAFDGAMAKSMFAKTEYDLAILDVNLPMFNGFQLCQELQANDRCKAQAIRVAVYNEQS